MVDTTASGIAAIGRSYVGFGTGFVDIDNDGWEDLVIANGHVIHHAPGGLPQQPVLLRNQGRGRFRVLTAQGGAYFQERHVGRGLALGDLDNDGWPDLVISHSNAPVVLLGNEASGSAKARSHWLGVELRGQEQRDVVGAKLTVEVGGRRLTRFAKGGGSYLSSNDRRLLFGLGTATHIDRLTVTWPWGQEQSWPGDQLASDQYHRLVE